MFKGWFYFLIVALVVAQGCSDKSEESREIGFVVASLAVEHRAKSQSFDVWSKQEAVSRPQVSRADLCQFLTAQSLLPAGPQVWLIQGLWDRSMSLKGCGYDFELSFEDVSKETYLLMPSDLKSHDLVQFEIDNGKKLFAGGIRILSRFEIKDGEAISYVRNGDSRLVQEDLEAMSLRGALKAKIQHPKLGDIAVATTSLVGSYRELKDDEVDRRTKAGVLRDRRVPPQFRSESDPHYVQQRDRQGEVLLRFVDSDLLEDVGVLGGQIESGYQRPYSDLLWERISGFDGVKIEDNPNGNALFIYSKRLNLVQKGEGKFQHFGYRWMELVKP